MGSPFIPFLVIFGNVMNMPNSVEDYQLIKNIGLTIDSAASQSKGLRKLNDICQNFLKVARARYEPVGHSRPSDSLSTTLPQQDVQTSVNQLPLPVDFGVGEDDPSAFNFMDFSMLDGWELGPGGGETAREFSSYFEQLPQTSFMGRFG